MKLSIFSFVAIAGLIAPQLAATASPSQTVPSIAALRGGNFGGTQTITLVSFYAGSSVGGGTLVASSGDTTSADDSCTIYLDAAGHRFRRSLIGNVLNVAMCGARCGGVQVMDGRSASGSANITSATARWTPAMVGWRAVVNRGGVSGRQIDTAVAAVTAPGSLTLVAAASVTGSGEIVSVYPDDTAALDRAIAAANKNKFVVQLPAKAICGYANPGISVIKLISGPGLQLNSGTLWLAQTGPTIDNGVGLNFTANGSSVVGPGTIDGLYQTDQGAPQFNTTAVLFANTTSSSIVGHVMIQNTKGRAFLASGVKNFVVSDVVLRNCGDFAFRPASGDIMQGRSMCGHVSAPSGTLTVKNYTANNAAQAGLLIYGPTDASFHATISNCHFSGSGYYGLDLEEINGAVDVSNCEHTGNGVAPSAGLIYGGYIIRDVARANFTNIKSSLTDSNAFVAQSVDANNNLTEWSFNGLQITGTSPRHAGAIYLAFNWTGSPQRVSLSKVGYDSITVYANSPQCSTAAPRQQLLTFDDVQASRLYTGGAQTAFDVQGNPGQKLYVQAHASDLGTVNVKPLAGNQNAIYFDLSGVQINGAAANSAAPFMCP